MHATSLQNKTVRPGSLAGYSYYHSNRRPISARNYSAPRPKLARSHAKLLRRVVVTALVLAALVVLPVLRGDPAAGKQTAASQTAKTSQAASPSQPVPASQPSAAPAVEQVSGRCKNNRLDKFILVSVSERHLWACQGSKQLYDSPVITGIEYYDSTLTPPGTYHIYGKQTDITLKGSDIVGSWNDPVKYWMPFLNNQFGTYGFHDATWRPDSAFGKVGPDSKNASHGCVELPLATSKWLYNWAQVGTTVTIES